MKKQLKKLSLSKSTLSNLSLSDSAKIIAGHWTGGGCNVPQRSKNCTNNQQTCKETCV